MARCGVQFYTYESLKKVALDRRPGATRLTQLESVRLLLVPRKRRAATFFALSHEGSRGLRTNSQYFVCHVDFTGALCFLDLAGALDDRAPASFEG